MSVSFGHSDQMHKENNWREERFILTHGFGGFSPWSLGPAASGTVWESTVAPLMTAGKKKSQEGQGRRGPDGL